MMRTLAITILGCLALLGCGEQETQKSLFGARPGHPQLHPTGRLLLDVTVGHDGLRRVFGFEVCMVGPGADRPVLFASTERYSYMHGGIVCWGDGDDVWVHSADVGTSCWVRRGEHDWERLDWDALLATGKSRSMPGPIRESLPTELRGIGLSTEHK